MALMIWKTLMILSLEVKVLLSLLLRFLSQPLNLVVFSFTAEAWVHGVVLTLFRWAYTVHPLVPNSTFNFSVITKKREVATLLVTFSCVLWSGF
jgi:hypothetical protein